MTYTEEYLIERLYEKLNQREKTTRVSFLLPTIVRENGKTIFVNFEQFCNACRRSMNHLSDFIKKSMNVELSISGKNELIINGSYDIVHIKKHLENYGKTYVICSSCKSGNTDIIKEDRLIYLICNNCMCKKPINNQL